VAERVDCLAVDCGRAAPAPRPAPRTYAGLDLMARDFDSLLRAMLDQLARLAPDWADRTEADFGMVLLELLAYAGDQLAYLHDRVALEGYLRTASQAESVRKLLSLIDCRIDPGRAAQAEVLVECVGVAPLFLARGFALSTRAAGRAPPVIYETIDDAVLYPVLSAIALSVDAPAGADGRQAVLRAGLAGALQPGAWLLFQQGEVREWAQVASAVFAPASTTVTLVQPLGRRYTAAGDPGHHVAPASVHGNRVRATHGASQQASQAGTGAPAQHIALELAPLTWVFDEASQQSRAALAVSVDGEAWTEVDDFIDSDATAQHYRVARDNGGYLTIHFGDGECGVAPAAGSSIVVRYRVGGGDAGHLASEALNRFDTRRAFADPSQHITLVRNPLPATAPRAPQSLAQAKLMGPAQLRQQNRAVTPADFERILAAGVRLGGQLLAPLQSRARIRHTGSWNTVIVSVDMPGRQPLAATPGARAAFEAALQAYKMAGLDVRVEDARYCALHIGLLVEVLPEHFARDVRHAVEQALVGPLAGGAAALFEAGRLGFGQPLFLSDLYAAACAVEGVRALAVTRFKRLGDRYPDDEAQGVIRVGALEVARCDNAPGATEFGVLNVRTCGGKEG
jgi:hypothetical protein